MQAVYHSQDIQAWEKRWFEDENSAYGLMQQVAWQIAKKIMKQCPSKQSHIAVCCGMGNNAGDGYLVAHYLLQHGYSVEIYAAGLGSSLALQRAYQTAQDAGMPIMIGFDFQRDYDIYIDALFGIGLDRELTNDWQTIIQCINDRQGLKIAIDVPSGLHADTGQPFPCAIHADICYTILGFKAGLFTGQGKQFSGRVELISLLPPDDGLQAFAYLASTKLHFAPRLAFGHKGSYGHILVIGGNADMGGAVIMAAEAAFYAGAGKVTVVCHAKHHHAILSRAPNIMIRDINQLDAQDCQALVQQADAVCFGMGLGRDKWAKQQYQKWLACLTDNEQTVVLDADALWFLAQMPKRWNDNCYLTPHPGEAATLLQSSVTEIEADRIATIRKLQQEYGGQWVLKGAGSLILEDQLWICTQGNPGMATSGMGDILAGLIASLKAQLKEQMSLHDIVTLHALAGDELAKNGMQGLQAHHMPQAICQMIHQTKADKQQEEKGYAYT